MSEGIMIAPALTAAFGEAEKRRREMAVHALRILADRAPHIYQALLEEFPLSEGETEMERMDSIIGYLETPRPLANFMCPETRLEKLLASDWNALLKAPVCSR